MHVARPPGDPAVLTEPPGVDLSIHKLGQRRPRGAERRIALGGDDGRGVEPLVIVRELSPSSAEPKSRSG